DAGGDGQERPPPTSDAPASGEGCLANSSTVQRRTAAQEEITFLVDAEVSRLDECADQVVWEFRSNGAQLPPGYSVEYGPGPFNDFTSGAEIEPAGDAYLIVRFRNASTIEVGGVEGEQEFETTYNGRESIDPSDLNHLLEARIVQGPEGVTQWVIGLDGERPFNVDASTEPPKVVLTIG
ncbi:MAG: hypothetical protein L0206_12980, partial [Actinobacteria bacterium]|nr:hypothetical protein [Actinomycetota bacterium]